MTTTDIDMWELVSLFHYETNDVSAWVRKGENALHLHWTDGINEWVEDFPSLSFAMLRLGALIACGESDWDKGFLTSPQVFTQQAGIFLSNTVG